MARRGGEKSQERAGASSWPGSSRLAASSTERAPRLLAQPLHCAPPGGDGGEKSLVTPAERWGKERGARLHSSFPRGAGHEAGGAARSSLWGAWGPVGSEQAGLCLPGEWGEAGSGVSSPIWGERRDCVMSCFGVGSRFGEPGRRWGAAGWEEPPLHVLLCCPGGWGSLSMPLKHVLPPGRPRWQLSSNPGGRSGAGGPRPSDGGTVLREPPRGCLRPSP